MTARIGISGGTFNPIHIGHLSMAEMAREKFQLDQVIFVPCRLPPHKTIPQPVSAGHRYRMVKAAVSGHSAFRVSDVEMKRPGKSYTIDTIHEFRRKFPAETAFFFIVGQDTFRQLPTWKGIDDLLGLVTFIVVNRPGYRPPRSPIRHLSVTMPGIDISSSYLRGRLQKGKSVKYLVPERVIRYIEKHQLYQS